MAHILLCFRQITEKALREHYEKLGTLVVGDAFVFSCEYVFVGYWNVERRKKAYKEQNIGYFVERNTSHGTVA